MRTVLASVLLLLVSFSVGATEINRIVLRVNNRITTLHDFESRRTERVLQIQRAELPTGGEARASSPESVRASSVRCTRRRCYSPGPISSAVAASEQEIDRSFRDTVDSLGIEGEEELAQALAASGLTENALRAQIRRGMIMQEIIAREVRPRVRLEEEEMRRYYRDNIDDFEAPERWQVQDAVVLGAADEDGAVAEIAADIRRRVASGESLMDAAKDYVELSKVTMIELGWVARGDLEGSLEAALVPLREDEVSDPVSGRGGLHILSVESYEAAAPKTFPNVEDQIASILQQDRFGNEMEAYLLELAESSYVLTDPPPGAEGFEVDLGREVFEETDVQFDDVPVRDTSEETGMEGDESEEAEADSTTDSSDR